MTSAPPRRWQPREPWQLGYVWYRVQPGVKAPGDLVLQQYAAGSGWRAVTMAAGFLLADFFFENEDRLYPPADGLVGGVMYLQHIRHAALFGWESAQRQLLAAQRRKLEARP